MKRIDATVSKDGPLGYFARWTGGDFTPGDRVAVMATGDLDELQRSAIGWAKPPPDSYQVREEGRKEAAEAIAAMLREEASATVDLPGMEMAGAFAADIRMRIATSIDHRAWQAFLPKEPLR